MKITRETLLAMQKGIPTKELEILKGLSDGKIDKNKIKENYQKSSAVASTDLDVNKVVGYNAKAPEAVSTDAIIGLLSGKKPKEIVNEGNAFIKTDNSVGSLLKDGANMSKTPLVENTSEPQTSLSSHNKEDIKEMIYEIFAEILGMSNEKSRDEEYIKKTLTEVYTFIKLKETLK